jgi:hypothetical protein
MIFIEDRLNAQIRGRYVRDVVRRWRTSKYVTNDALTAVMN